MVYISMVATERLTAGTLLFSAGWPER